jgi:acetate kinase
VNVLILNCGSSSQGFKVYRRTPGREPTVVIAGKARGVAVEARQAPVLQWMWAGAAESKQCDLSTHARAAEAILAVLRDKGVTVDVVGHRFVHGGGEFTCTAPIDASTWPLLHKTVPLAPIHNPNTLSVIEVCRRRLAEVPQYAVFDTAFHAAMPEAMRTCPLPQDLAKEFGFRKYGFHGLSYQYVSQRAADLLQRPLDDLSLIVCHLGTGGSSMAAVRAGRSIDTSMGYSPLSGLVMSTRCGDLDAQVVLALVRSGLGADQIEELLNNRSGLLGLSGFSSDLAEVIARADEGDHACRLAYDVYVARLRHYLGAYFWLLGGADAIVFTDDVGVNVWQVRAAACEGVEASGVGLDPVANQRAVGGATAFVQTPASRTAILVVPTDEERVILDEVVAQLESRGAEAPAAEQPLVNG